MILLRFWCRSMTPSPSISACAASPRTRQNRTLPKPVKQFGSGSFALSRSARKAPRAPISVDVNTDVDEVIPSTAARQYISDIGMATYDSWAGKKTG